MSPDVFITGIGMVTPAGLTAEATWRGLLAGGRYVAAAGGQGENSDGGLARAGIGIRCAGQVRLFTPPRGSENLDRVCQFALAAAQAALESAGMKGWSENPPSHPTQAGVLSRETSPDRAAVSIGTSKGGLLSCSESFPRLMNPRKTRGQTTADEAGAAEWRDHLVSIPPDAAARVVAARFGITGGVHATVAACSTGTLSFIRGCELIRDGGAELVLAGSSDASVHPLWFAAFEQMGVLAPEHPRRGPAWAGRPFDRTRSGFAIGEGAAVLVVESGESIRRRGIRPVARVAGWARATDPCGLTQLSLDGEPLAWAISKALERADGRAANLACVHAHGTGTRSNDLVEARAIRSVLGESATPVVSIKGALGHLLGAAGAVELAVAAMSCQTGLTPGTATLIEADPELGPLHLPTATFGAGRGPVLKTSLGFGGHVTAVVLTPE